ncbi:MAG: 4Fe-4S binding protein [Campylobacterales bacterium]|nr:4Fe-4S binding protein [Campylobacterales bacterium]
MTNRRDFFGRVVGIVRHKKEEERFFPFAPFFDASKTDVCKTCENPTCVSSCPEGIIFKNEQEAPRIDFSKRGCTFCKDCASSCIQNIFSTSNKATIDAAIEIDPSGCLAWHNTICKSCFDPCLERAIDFSGLFYPSIIPEKCTACGFCISVCPADAIKIKRSQS